MQSEEKVSSHKDKPWAAAQEAGANAASATPSAPPPTAGMATPRNTAGLTRQGSGRAGGTPKPKDTPKTTLKGASRSSKKTVPASFVEVIDCLVDVTLRYKGMQPGEEAELADPVVEAMETDEPFSISAQLPDGRMVTVSASQPARATAAATAQPGAASGAALGMPAIKATFTEQVRLHLVTLDSTPCLQHLHAQPCGPPWVHALYNVPSKVNLLCCCLPRFVHSESSLSSAARCTNSGTAL